MRWRSFLLLPLLAALLLVAPSGTASAQPTGTLQLAARGVPHAPIGGAGLTQQPMALPASAPAFPEITAGSFVVADLDSGEILAAKAPHTPFAPASTLKTLTALTLLPRIPQDAVLTPSNDDLDVDGTKVGLVPGEHYTAKEVFESLLMVSGNDSANVLASRSGDPATTIGWMNAEAKKLRALDTVAVNPSGLDAPGQQSSAYDLGLIARAAMKLPVFARDVSTVRSQLSAPGGTSFQTYNHDSLLTKYDGAIGIKGGYTVASRASFVAAAQRGTTRILVTLMHTNDGPLSQREAAAMLDWGFAASAADVAPVGRLVDPVGAHATATPDGATTGVADANDDNAGDDAGAQSQSASEGVTAAGPTQPTHGAGRLLIGAALVLAFALAAVRRRVVRRRYRSRLRLPRY